MSSSGFRRIGNLPGSRTSKPQPQINTSDSVLSFQNQRLPGLSTGTGPRTTDQTAVQSPAQQLIGMRTPETGVQLSAKRTTDAVRLTNQRLMSLAQQQGAKRRARMQPQQAVGQPSAQGMYQGHFPGDGHDHSHGGDKGSGPFSFQGYRGGSTLRRVASVLGNFPGLRVTDTHSDRRRDLALGLPRSPNSYHYDGQNPAVDIAGSPAQLHRLYRQLVAMGGWRQILWQVPGHYDHIHIA